MEIECERWYTVKTEHRGEVLKRKMQGEKLMVSRSVGDVLEYGVEVKESRYEEASLRGKRGAYSLGKPLPLPS